MRSAPTLTGTGFTLRPWRESDAPALEPACADAEIRRFSWVPPSYSPDAAASWIAHQHERLHEGTTLTLAIEAAGADLPVGMVGIFALDEPDRASATGSSRRSVGGGWRSRRRDAS